MFLCACACSLTTDGVMYHRGKPLSYFLLWHISSLFPGWGDRELPHRRDAIISAENHSDPWRFRVPGLHHTVWGHRHTGAIYFTWGKTQMDLKNLSYLGLDVKTYFYCPFPPWLFLIRFFNSFASSFLSPTPFLTFFLNMLHYLLYNLSRTMISSSIWRCICAQSSLHCAAETISALDRTTSRSRLVYL